MTGRARRGGWVELHQVLLQPAERAPQVPEDTRAVPLEMRVRGFLTHDAAIGEDAEILTAAGRLLRGRLTSVDPAYTHGFGPPVPELAAVGEELRAMLRKSGGSEG